MTAIVVMTMLPPFPRASAYICTKGWGASRANTVFRSGVQNRKRIVVTKPKMPVAIALLNIPFPATTLVNCQHGTIAFLQVRSVPRVSRLLGNVSRGIKTCQCPRSKETCFPVNIYGTITRFEYLQR